MLGAYIRSFKSEWATLMTGALTIPLTVAAFYIDSTWQRVIFGAFALLCAVVASYRTWARERSEVLELQAALAIQRPRIVLGFEYRRGYDQYAADPRANLEPFFLRNDGNDTAINLRIGEATASGSDFTFATTANHVAARDVVGVHIFRERERFDQEIDRTIVNSLESSIRSGAVPPIHVIIPVRITYEDRTTKYDEEFEISSGAVPRTKGGYQMLDIRVERRAPETGAA